MTKNAGEEETGKALHVVVHSAGVALQSNT